jgi:hypothetical protein
MKINTSLENKTREISVIKYFESDFCCFTDALNDTWPICFFLMENFFY